MFIFTVSIIINLIIYYIDRTIYINADIYNGYNKYLIAYINNCILDRDKYNMGIYNTYRYIILV